MVSFGKLIVLSCVKILPSVLYSWRAQSFCDSVLLQVENKILELEKLDMHARSERTLKECCGNSLYSKTLLKFQSRDPTQHFSRIHLLVHLNTPFWKVIFCTIYLHQI